MNLSKNRISSSEKLDDPSEDDSPPSLPLKHFTDSCCQCCPSMVSESSDQAYGADDETDIRQDDDHASPQATSGMTNQTDESIEWSLAEGHVTSRFPVSFARTRLPHGHENGALLLSALKHCRCRTSNLQSDPAIALAHSNRTGPNPVSRTGTGLGVNWQHAAVDKSHHHLSRTGGAPTSYSRVST